jgi:hypothetical protein
LRANARRASPLDHPPLAADRRGRAADEAVSVGAEMTFGVVARDREGRDRQIAARKARRRNRR